MMFARGSVTSPAGREARRSDGAFDECMAWKRGEGSLPGTRGRYGDATTMKYIIKL
jgi:hypothetical protein